MVSSRAPRTLLDAYAARLRRDAASPLVTFYDLDTGERIELSGTTWVNWAAKVAGLLTDELDLARGDLLRVDLGAHWQTSVVLGGAWWAGLQVAGPGGAVDVEPAAVVCAERDVATYAEAGVPVLALSLKPLSGPCGPLPSGVLDFGREVLAMPDAYAPLDPPDPDDVALRTADGDLTHADLVAAPHDERVLTDRSPATRAGARLLAGALTGAGSLVLVPSAGTGVPATVTEQERVSRTDLAT